MPSGTGNNGSGIPLIDFRSGIEDFKQISKGPATQAATGDKTVGRPARRGRAWFPAGALRPDHGPVAPPRTAPVIVEVRRAGGEGIPRRRFLVHVDAEPRSLARPQGAVPDLGAAGKHLPRLPSEPRPLVNAEVVAGQLDSG